MSHICVDMTRRLSANAIFNGHVVFRLLWTGIPSMTKIWVAPESVIASLDVIVIVAYAHFELCRFSGVERIPLPSSKTPRGANEENADC